MKEGYVSTVTAIQAWTETTLGFFIFMIVMLMLVIAGYYVIFSVFSRIVWGDWPWPVAG